MPTEKSLSRRSWIFYRNLKTLKKKSKRSLRSLIRMEMDPSLKMSSSPWCSKDPGIWHLAKLKLQPQKRTTKCDLTKIFLRKSVLNWLTLKAHLVSFSINWPILETVKRLSLCLIQNETYIIFLSILYPLLFAKRYDLCFVIIRKLNIIEFLFVNWLSRKKINLARYFNAIALYCLLR